MLDVPEPHIRVLWGVQYVTPSFARATPEDGKVLAFTQDVHLGMLPVIVRVNHDWMTVRNVPAPTITELNTTFATTGPGAKIIP